MMRSRKVGYRVATALVVMGLLLGGVAQLVRFDHNVETVVSLGYPVYLLTILGTWKVLGAVALVVPGFPRITEWAYAGTFFVLSGATLSHVAVGDGIGKIGPPLFFAGLTLVSRVLRTAPPSE